MSITDPLCEGCNKTAAKDRPLMDVKISLDGPTIKVHSKGVGTRSYGSYPRKEPVTACMRKAIYNLSRCPVCGEIDGCFPRPCQSCQTWIQTARDQDAVKGNNDAVVVSLNASLLGYRTSTWKRHETKIEERLKEALAQTASVDGTRRDPFLRHPSFGRNKQICISGKHLSPTTGNYGLMTTSRQAEALQQLVDAIHEIEEGAFKAGFNEGRDVLFGLASGKLSIDQVNKESAKINKE